MFNNFGNDISFQNPMINTMNQQMGSPITEQEIQNHKNKLNDLITKLINTHNIDEETSINNEIKKQTEFLNSLLNIKRNELNRNNNNMNNNANNIFFNPMLNQNDMIYNMNNGMMNNNLLQQQMMKQQQMMSKQLLTKQLCKIN